MQKNVMSFRADYQTSLRIAELMALEQKRCETLGLPPVSRSDLINKSIESYYFTKKRDKDLDPISERVYEAVEKIVRQNIQTLVNAINVSHLDILINQEYSRLLCKALNFDEAKDGLDKLLNAEMPWDIAIPERVHRKYASMEDDDGKR